MDVRKKNKKKIIIAGLAIVAIILVIILIVVLSKKSKNKNENPNSEDTTVYELPDTTYTGIEVTDIELDYLEDNDETMVTMIFNNNSERNVSKEALTAYLLNEKGETLGSTLTYIESLNIGEQYSISVILKGDLSATKQVSLQESASTSSTETMTTSDEETEEPEETEETEEPEEVETKKTTNTTANTNAVANTTTDEDEE